ncbi:hypothetical protein DH2020_009707 [Rehmannia glutinosa]|uniref:Peroxidase n=1 Tax=Rehmannia glutinosa TaxID=99300 RepID=A0ABR0X9J4_REHGL
MSSKLVKTFISMLLCFLYIVKSEGQLKIGFYRSSCGLAEFIVKQEVRNGFIKDNGVAAGLVRMHFHDCFVRGCDGSVLIDSTPSNNAEKDVPPNNPSLRGFEVIDNAKKKLEALCKGVVSCADILAFAARDSVEITGGFGYDVPAGRRDGRVSLASEALSDLPPPTFDVNQLTQAFANKGLTQDEMALQFQHKREPGPTLDPMYAAQLKQQCPQGSNANLVVPMDPSSPAMTDVGYYRGVLLNRGLFTSDQTLLTIPRTRAQVVQNVQNPLIWMSKFGAAMVNMGKIGVLTGNDGEIRANCRVING